jgi:cysteine desulfurase NifS/selenium donor protein
MIEKPIYLDYNATTPIDPKVADAMLPYLYERFGNPSSSHAYGAEAKNGVEQARQEIAGMLGCLPEEIVFTSGGSEANNMAIKGAAMANRERGRHIITSSVEHPAVLEVCAYLEQNGFRVTYLTVDEYGQVNPSDVENAITPETILISIMHANNEVGTIQPIHEISKIAHSHHILMHTDAAQSIGKIPVNVDELGVDLLSVAGHKLYAPKGIGVLYMRTGTSVGKLIHGASHERNLRAGTENVLEIAGLGKACALIVENLAAYAEHMKEMRDLLEAEIVSRFPWVKVNGHPEQRLPNTSSISFRHLEANTILAELAGVAASAGAACHADQVDVSHVLEAMRLPVDYAMGTIRFSVGRFTTREEIAKAVEEVSRVVKRLTPDSTPTKEDAQDLEVKLTQFTHGMGCACKLRPQLLEQVLAEMPLPQDKHILVGTETGDDAAVYLINEETAIVQTVDFFTPIVDDPYTFGAISAANSLSDVYAMGAEPLFALSVVGFPSSRLPLEVLKSILRGANDKAEEAGIAIIGGHTVDDTEPKFGLAVTGRVHPKHIITNAGAQPGDLLLLTKPIGTGILTTARKQGLIELDMLQDAVKAMSELNDVPARLMQEVGAHACTDVTGFGLLGHLLGMMKASGTTAHIQSQAVPSFEHSRDLAAGGSVPGGTKDNMSYIEPFTAYDARIPLSLRFLLNDAQTSGGLLVSLSEPLAEEFMQKMQAAGRTAWMIGKVAQKSEKFIQVI